MVATEDDRDGAGRGDLADLAVDHRVGPLDVRRDDVRVAGVDHGQDVERVDVELERMDGARGVLRLADRPWPEPRARSMADRVIERRPDDGDVHRTAPQLVRIGDPRQLHERDRPDVGRQVEVGVGRELLVPAGVMRERVLCVGVVRVVSHQCLRRRSRQVAAESRSVSLGGAAGSSCRPAGRATGDGSSPGPSFSGSQQVGERRLPRAARAGRHRSADSVASATTTRAIMNRAIGSSRRPCSRRMTSTAATIPTQTPRRTARTQSPR